MKLSQYVRKHNVNRAALARKLGIEYNTFYSACKGHDILVSTAIKIVEGLKGEVTLADLNPTAKRKRTSSPVVDKDRKKNGRSSAEADENPETRIGSDPIE